MANIIGWLIVVVGWVISYRLTIAAQNKAFLNQIMNEARKDILHALRECQSWLGEVQAKLMSIKAGFAAAQFGFVINWEQTYLDILNLVTARAQLEWAFRLEEYEILFPETRNLRIDLLQRIRNLRKHITEDSYGITKGIAGQRNFIDAIERYLPILADLTALFEDLVIYLQNKSLHKITGNRVPPRCPLDPSLPRVVLQGEELRIISSETTTQ